MVKNVKDNEKDFFKYINNKRPATKWRRNPGEGTQERLIYQMPSVHQISLTRPWESLSQVTGKKEWWKEDTSKNTALKEEVQSLLKDCVI